MLADRVGQGGNLGRIEVPPGLKRVRVDPVDGQVDEVGGLERGGLESALVGAQERVEAASESALIHGRCPP